MAGTTHHLHAGRLDRRGRRSQPPVRITSAAESPGRDLAMRQRRYLISMSVRVVCFVGAIAVHGWLRWVLVAGALILPYVAVVMANAASPRIDEAPLTGHAPRHKELGE